jgi:hypothetical protein
LVSAGVLRLTEALSSATAAQMAERIATSAVVNTLFKTYLKKGEQASVGALLSI